MDRLEDFLYASLRASTPDGLFDIFREFLKEEHVHAVSIHKISSDHNGFRPSLVGLDFPKEWVAQYERKGLFEHDPIIAASKTQMSPYRWFDVATWPNLRDEQHRFLELLSSQHFTDGLAVPIHGPWPENLYFGLGTFSTASVFSKDRQVRLQTACFQFGVRYYELFVATPRNKITLSTRELEVLERVASGCSNQQIASDLGVSAHTVDTLLRRSYVKLDCNNRTVAAVRAVKYSLIRV